MVHWTNPSQLPKWHLDQFNCFCMAYHHDHMDCTVEYYGLLHRWVRRWAKSPIRNEQTLLHRSHGHAVLVLLTTWCLRAARFLCRLATHSYSKAAMAVRHVERHSPRSSGALTSDCGCMPHLFRDCRVSSFFCLYWPEYLILV